MIKYTRIILLKQIPLAVACGIYFGYSIIANSMKYRGRLFV